MHIFAKKALIRNGLNNILAELNLFDSQAVFFYDKKESWKHIISIETQSRLDIIKPSAFYIFNSQPYILFFDLTSINFDKQKEIEIHKQVWSFDQSPIVFIIKDEEVEIFNAFAFEKNKNRLQRINIDHQERNKLFSFWSLQSGSTWNWLKDNYYKDKIKNKRVSQKLFENIRDVRERLTIKENGNALTDDEANTLILRLIFIRYLIDRDVKLDKEYIFGLTKDEKRRAFINLLSKPKSLNKFFIILNEKFNGVLFKDVKFELTKAQAVDLAKVFSGEVPEKGSLFYGSDFFFEIFDFSIIPVELISGIYESLIDPETRKLQASVYTPPFLVEYMLGETLDQYFSQKHNKKKTECKVFDPAVGSGIFLVQSYRRMVDREIEIYNKISKVRLREIAEKNLFGIDINGQALKVTCFSIYIAMLDYQDPKTILDNFHFPKLIGTNLFEANFFDNVHPFNKKIVEENIDFILGNPPWKSDKDLFHIKWVEDTNKVIGRYEIAQSFLLRAKDFMHHQTTAALIVTSTIFYNVSSTTKEFKQKFLTNYCIDCFFDLSPVRRLIFEEKNNPCAIVYFKLSQREEYSTNVVKHLSVKWNIFLKYFKSLVIEKFDQKKIPQIHFINFDWMFKVALYGGALDFKLMLQFSNCFQKIANIVESQDFTKGDGIYKGSPKDHFDFLIGKQIIETESIKPFYTNVHDSTYRLKKQDVYLESGRKEKLFDGEKLLLKHRTQNESSLVISYTDKPVVFRHGVYGITTKTRTDDLKLIYGFFISEVFTYYQFLTSSSWGVGTRPEIKLDEYLSFPLKDINERTRKIIISSVDQIILNFKDWYQDFKLGSPSISIEHLATINNLIENNYDISSYKKDIINYVLNVSRYQFQENKQDLVVRKVHNDREVIEDYIQVFLEEFQRIYTSEYIRVEVYALDFFIGLNFVFEFNKPEDPITFIYDNTDESKILKILSSKLSIIEKAKNLYIQKDIKGFEENSFYIIKPNEYKCWHRAIAWYDMAEIKDAIETAEIDYLNRSWNAT